MISRADRHRTLAFLASWTVLHLFNVSLADNVPDHAAVSLWETLTPTAIHDAADGDLNIVGHVTR